MKKGRQLRRRKIDSKMERQFITALIVSKPFLASVSPILDLSLIQANHFRLVAEWCLDYFKQYGDAPGNHIESIYHSWVENQEQDDGEVEAIRDFLDYLSKQYESAESLNVAYLLDEFGSYLSLKELNRLSDDLSYSLLKGNTVDAIKTVREFSAVDLGKGAGFDPLNDKAAWERAFADPAEALLAFPGDAGRFFNKAFTRDALIGIQGPEKRGKTWWCVEFVLRALRNRKKVALFEVGDLSESQIMRRLGVRLAGQPMWGDQCGTILVPKRIVRTEEDEEDENAPPVKMRYREKDCQKTISRRACVRTCRKFMRGCGISRKVPHVMFSIHSNSSINVAGIEGILERWAHEKEFIPDVIIIDYADILSAEDTRKEVRHQVNDTWKALRRLSQEYHCLVIAPTQADAASYKTKIQSMSSFSEDKRKLAHVTGMIGLNQSPEEKEMSVMRLNWIVLRESEFFTNRCLYVGQCLPLGRAFCCGVM